VRPAVHTDDARALIMCELNGLADKLTADSTTAASSA
jgi:hypothetical protein